MGEVHLQRAWVHVISSIDSHPDRPNLVPSLLGLKEGSQAQINRPCTTESGVLTKPIQCEERYKVALITSHSRPLYCRCEEPDNPEGSCED